MWYGAAVMSGCIANQVDLGWVELRRPWGFSPEARRGSQGASRAEPDILEFKVKWAFRKHHYEQS